MFEAGSNPVSPVETTPGRLPSLSMVDDTPPGHADEVARFCRAADTQRRDDG